MIFPPRKNEQTTPPPPYKKRSLTFTAAQLGGEPATLTTLLTHASFVP